MPSETFTSFDAVDAVSDLPDPTSVVSGRQWQVTSDPDAKNNGIYTAVGNDPGLPAKAIVQ